MMMKTMSQPVCDDSELVGRSLAGDRDAFGQIVARYQSLICSLAYSAHGNLSHSEDLAQETFLTAWKQLAALREPAKLRPWLCGIARNLIRNRYRRDQREPSHHAEALDETLPVDLAAAEPSAEAINREEEAVLWRSLETIPETYREPLVLFYREGQSIERVAERLDLSEDAVRQRLSRGRNMLREQVAAFVEGALQRSIPGQAFTQGVLVALPSAAGSTKAALLATGAAKAGVTAKAAVATGVFGALLTPFMSIFGTWLGYKTAVDTSRTELERQFVKKFYRSLTINIVVSVAVLGLLIAFAEPLMAVNHWLFPALLGAYIAWWFVGLGFSVRKNIRRREEFLKAQVASGAAKPRVTFEYRSRACFLGLPLVHIQFVQGMPDSFRQVRAWIAAGGYAVGGLFAFGGIAVAPISFGAFSIGLVSVGGAAIGLLTFGAMTIGAWSFGAMSVGWFAFGACALGWKAACGAVAVARDYALGGFAKGMEANTDIARDAVLAHRFYRVCYTVLPYLAWMNLFWLAPLLCKPFIKRMRTRRA